MKTNPMMTSNLKKYLNPQVKTLSILTSGNLMMLIKRVSIINSHPNSAKGKAVINRYKMRPKMKRNEL